MVQGRLGHHKSFLEAESAIGQQALFRPRTIYEMQTAVIASILTLYLDSCDLTRLSSILATSQTRSSISIYIVSGC
jgi:hypothetical protein